MSTTPSSYSISTARSLAASPANSAFLNGNGNGNGTNGFLSVSNGFGKSVSHEPSEPTAGPSSVPDSIPPQSSRNEQILSHLYNEGFQKGHFADTFLYTGPKYFRLHAIVLAQSPYLMRLLSSTHERGTIYVPLEQFTEFTESDFVIALGYLYSSNSSSNITKANARGVLAAACLLEGMDDLCAIAYQQCRESITIETIQEWVVFVSTLPGNNDGTQSPLNEVQRPNVLGTYGTRLRMDVLNFLISDLPKVCGSTPEGRTSMLNVLARVPFELFKAILESPAFLIGSEQERFRFAKEAIALRKRTRVGQPVETVVLAFGHTESVVHVTRSTKRRALFKVSGES